MAKTVKAAKKNLSDVLNDLDKDRKASGCTLSNSALAFIVQVVKAAS